MPNDKPVLRMNESIDSREVAEINTVDLCQAILYLPTCHIIGHKDELFQTAQATELQMDLMAKKVRSKVIVVFGVGYAFDTRAEEGGVENKSWTDAVRWVTGSVSGG